MGDIVDPSSSTRSGWLAKHYDLKLSVNFDEKVLKGSVIVQVESGADSATELYLDSRNLSIESVKDNGTGERLDFETKLVNEALGSGVRITMSAAPKGTKREVALVYTTSPTASGIQWLTPEQTSGKAHPYLFTQCQAIHARSVFPCQDTPFVKCPYTAEITVPAPLVALMSAESLSSTKDDSSITYTFKQKVPMPSYLTALVVGALESRELGPRSRVWAEKDVVEKAAWEFEATESMLAAAEGILGEYVWGRYDLLVLPPSFPYGGMENPMLTFVTPTLLAGDRSLVNVVAHEISHSWTGNLVTNQTWEHFWLNEGFTVFVERKIQKALEGEKSQHFHAIGGLKALSDSVDVFGATNPLTALVPKLEGIDPDDAFSSVPYEKGFNFLFYLETLVGGAKEMDPFLRAYIQKFKYKSIITQDFQDFFTTFFSSKADVLKQVDWNAWYTTPGMPIISNKFDDTLAKEPIALANKCLNAPSDCDIKFSDELKGFSSNQTTLFLDKILTGGGVSLPVLKAMDRDFGFSSKKNSEIRFRWQRVCLMAEYEPIFSDVGQFLTEQGRMKFVRPLYRELNKCKKAGDLAKTLFAAHKDFYHPICSTLIAKDLQQ